MRICNLRIHIIVRISTNLAVVLLLAAIRELLLFLSSLIQFATKLNINLTAQKSREMAPIRITRL